MGGPCRVLQDVAGFPLLPPLPNAARSPRLPPGSLFSFDRRWSIFLRPLSCFCFATETPVSGGQNLSTLGSCILWIALWCTNTSGQFSWEMNRGHSRLNHFTMPVANGVEGGGLIRKSGSAGGPRLPSSSEISLGHLLSEPQGRHGGPEGLRPLTFVPN